MPGSVVPQKGRRLGSFAVLHDRILLGDHYQLRRCVTVRTEPDGQNLPVTSYVDALVEILCLEDAHVGSV
jgi:hypothetical protein